MRDPPVDAIVDALIGAGGLGVPDDDRFLWLEELDSPEAQRWVAERNGETLTALGDAEFKGLKDAIRETLDSKERIPYPEWHGDGFYYDFWRDADHPRGLWRRTTLEQFRRDAPEWDVLLDVDALNAAEGENWTWSEATLLPRSFDRCLISLSRGGADAVVVREFDLGERTFVKDGFALPEAKSAACWIDQDTIFVGTDFGADSMTSSGYPRIVKRWRRGTPLTEADVVFAGRPEDVLVSAGHDATPGFERDHVYRMIDFHRWELFLFSADGDLVRLDVPDDASAEWHREWLLIRLRSAWLGHPAGALLATRFDDFLAGGRDLTVLFTPDARTSLSGYEWTRHHLLLLTMTDVRTSAFVLTPGEDGWRREPLPGAPDSDDDLRLVDTDPERDDAYLIASEGFLRPATLHLGRIGGPAEVLKREPAFFDTAGMAVRQFFAVSADGTRVPYFVVGGPGNAPTILHGYGGFEISLTPGYDGALGRGWLALGGTYVVANIRGGGEYGPDWHQAALRENRLRAYEDFAAVAVDLVTRGITTPERLGITGGSNGGLLMGVMLTRYPELFGAVVASVPLLDMSRYTKLLAGNSWAAEYGDPDVEDDWSFLRGYSPYHQVRPDRPYPPILFLTSTRDDRVHPGHARKMAAKLRELGHEVAYYENVEGGHRGAADNEQAATVRALSLRFLRRELRA